MKEKVKRKRRSNERKKRKRKDLPSKVKNIDQIFHSPTFEKKMATKDSVK